MGLLVLETGMTCCDSAGLSLGGAGFTTGRFSMGNSISGDRSFVIPLNSGATAVVSGALLGRHAVTTALLFPNSARWYHETQPSKCRLSWYKLNVPTFSTAMTDSPACGM
jgi:hypothetical protein